MVTSRSATVSSLPPYSPALLDGSPTAPNAGTPRPQPDVGNNQNQGNLVVAPVEGTDPQDPPMSPGQILAGALISLAILLLGALIFGCAIISE